MAARLRTRAARGAPSTHGTVQQLTPHLQRAVLTIGLALASPICFGGQDSSLPRPISPSTGDPDWHIAPPPADVLEAEPADPAYARLRDAWRRYSAIEASGGWPLVPRGATLAAGFRDPQVLALRDRLRASGDFSGEINADAWLFDQALADAVQRFQRRHGLRDDGVVGNRTLAALNVTAATRAGQLRATLERWRWLPRSFEPRHVRVNLAEAQLTVFDGVEVLSMPVIVGHRDRPTPSLRDEIRQVVFHPTWSVPRRIAAEDLLPRQQADPGFLARQHIRVIRGTQNLDPALIDWRNLSAERLPYRFEQAAGPWNSLGRLKFVLGNPFDIYLHDTPLPGLFGLNSRTLSSGCVRLAEPVALAKLLLGPAFDLDAALADQRTRAVTVNPRMPVYLLYLTSRVSDDGTVHFRDDIYGRDARLAAALSR